MKKHLQSMIIRFLSLGCLVLSGCAHSIHQYAVSDSHPSGDLNRGKMISATAEQFVILSFAFDTNYADRAYQNLLAKCPQGEIIHINSRYSTSMSFLSYTNKLFLQAICID